MGYPKYLQDLVATSYDMWSKGWDEYNGGNISYRLTQENVQQLGKDFAHTDYPLYSDGPRISDLLAVPSHFVGEYLLITASGSHFRYLKEQVATDTGIVKISETGYQVVAGFATGKHPTSEIFMHILAHAKRVEKNPQHRVVIHNHATNIVLYSLLNEVTSESLTRALWSVLTESIVVFPDGIEVLPWIVPGTHEIGVQTAKLLENCRLVVWAKHGVLSTGVDYQDCFGLIETANKAAGIALDLERISGKPLYENNVLTDDQLRAVCDVLRVKGRYL